MDQINLNVLQRRDAKIVGIIESASQVAVYSFDSNAKEWAKTAAEGALFICVRNCEPTHTIVVNNRLNRENFAEAITNDMEFAENDEHYLLYKKGGEHIRAIWFYNQLEYAKIFALVKSLSNEITTKKSQRPPIVPTSPAQSGAPPNPARTPDIVSMLNKAHHRYDQNAQKKHQPVAVSGAPLPLTSLFRNESAPKALNDQQAETCSSSSTSSDASKILQRLMSHPASQVFDNAADDGNALNRSFDKITNTSSSNLSSSSAGAELRQINFNASTSNASLMPLFDDQQLLLTPADLTAPTADILNLSLSDPVSPSSAALGEEAFVKAFVDLLHTDAAFVTSLHQAYLRAIAGSKR